MQTKTEAPNIVWGVCGIGHGHIFRQLSLIEEFAQHSRIILFGYGESLGFFQRHFAKQQNVHTLEVAVPYYIGGPHGLDFHATAAFEGNQKDCTTLNAETMARTWDMIKEPNLVISDYEPVSAQYAYACNAPLVTVDQQSKYLAGDFPTSFAGQSCQDEIMRLRMFFPKAEKRLACSFFRVPKLQNCSENVEICPSVINDKVLAIHRRVKPDNSLVIYLTAQKAFGQSMDEIKEICASFPKTTFHVFGKNVVQEQHRNLFAYQHGDPAFHRHLASCSGIISTAGHGLLSEAMHLGIPVYAIPLPLYEQQMNASIIQDHNFGVADTKINKDRLATFIEQTPKFVENIHKDDSVLVRGSGKQIISSHLHLFLK